MSTPTLAEIAASNPIDLYDEAEMTAVFAHLLSHPGCEHETLVSSKRVIYRYCRVTNTVIASKAL